jgi:hypothetical protein
MLEFSRINAGSTRLGISLLADACAFEPGREEGRCHGPLEALGLTSETSRAGHLARQENLAWPPGYFEERFL